MTNFRFFRDMSLGRSVRKRKQMCNTHNDFHLAVTTGWLDFYYYVRFSGNHVKMIPEKSGTKINSPFFSQ